MPIEVGPNQHAQLNKVQNMTSHKILISNYKHEQEDVVEVSQFKGNTIRIRAIL